MLKTGSEIVSKNTSQKILQMLKTVIYLQPLRTRIPVFSKFLNKILLHN